MNLHRLLQEGREAGRPVRAGLIGAGKFGTMFLAQVPSTQGLDVPVIADLSPDRARASCRAAGWSEEHIAATRFVESGAEAIATPGLDAVIEATGDPVAGLVHAEAALAEGRHMIMVNVEADALAGPLMAARFRRAGLVWSMAYGDQPALVAEMVDWARAAGFAVVAAGKGTKYLPAYHESTPETVWQHYGLTPEEAAEAGMNPKMFNSFLDGTKSAIEMAAIANACDLAPPAEGLAFPPAGMDDLARVLRPRAAGGVLEREGMVEVVSSLHRDGSEVARDLRWGIYVVFRAENPYSAACFAQYGVQTDDSGQYAALYRPFHLIGMELGISVLSVALRGEPTGSPLRFAADVVAVAKRDLGAGEVLDGEGGATVWGRLMPAEASLAASALPIGLASGLPLARPARRGQVLTWDHVDTAGAPPQMQHVIGLRRQMERAGAAPAGEAQT